MAIYYLGTKYGNWCYGLGKDVMRSGSLGLQTNALRDALGKAPHKF